MALIYRKSLSLLSSDVPEFTSFEAISATLESNSRSLHIVSMYCPPSTFPYAKTVSVFMAEFSTLLSSLMAKGIIAGDLNIHLDDSSDTQTQQIRSRFSM